MGVDVSYMSPTLVHEAHMWQFQVEMERHSMAYFDCITTFKAL